MVDIPALNSQIQTLQYWADLWNAIRLWLALTVAIVGVLAFVAFYTAHTYSEKLAAAKEEQRQKEREQHARQITEANERTTKLELRLQREARERAEAEDQLELLRKAQLPRSLPLGSFRAALRHKPTASAEILYQAENPEAFVFAVEIYMALHSVSWDVGPFPAPIRLEDSKSLPNVPAVVAAGGSYGVTIITNVLDPSSSMKNTSSNALRDAFLSTGLGVGVKLDTKLPDNFFRIIVVQDHHS